MCPFSDGTFDLDLCAWVRSQVPPTTIAILLDVGAGAGKFSGLLPEYTMDAVEPWEPYQTEFNLFGRYRKVWGVTIQQFLRLGVCLGDYSCIILGDVLEHLSVEDAQSVIRELSKSGVLFIVKVPFLYEQIVTEDNLLENHLQPDLTNDVMLQRYPELTPIALSPSFGVYVRRNV